MLDNLLKRYAAADKEAAILQSTIHYLLIHSFTDTYRTLRFAMCRRPIIPKSHLMQTHCNLTDAFMLFKLGITDK